MSINLNESPHGNTMVPKGLALGYLTEPGSLNRALFLTEKAHSFGWAFSPRLQPWDAGKIFNT